ncbi:ABC transporter ATP-binding protein [Galactobacter caseinivorans]|uniref:ABC-type quaternary amine transporter n=1 Tax=Galactobacter caseinivorans TaxID=2676123 RepID=A0A496PFN2_9MICC|nr:ABC transporter ATP-binding protein [Galactobacter caseinivorans]RKW69416.1 ABC transporter ATP-binding protein [Galactobacter caseinivorans]
MPADATTTNHAAGGVKPTRGGDHASSGTEGLGAAVSLVEVVKKYGSTTVLHGVTLELQPGELVCLLGPSGCGKTTALRCLAGLEEVSGGAVLIGGEDVSAVPVNKRDIGMVFQAYSLFPHLTVAKNVAFGLERRGVPRAARDTRVEDSLRVVGLEGFEDRFPHQLSGGQQQRVALARALVTRPKALLLDEPLSALDAKVRVRLREQIRAIVTELGITTVFVTHDQEEALAISDRVAVMNGGRIEQLGTPEELYRKPATPFVANFVGLSNRLRGVVQADGVLVHGRVLPVGSLDGASVGDEVMAFVRPEHVRVERVGGAGAGSGGAGGALAGDGHGMPGTVVSSGFLGSLRRTVVKLEVDAAGGSEEIAVQHGADDDYEPGEAVILTVAPEPVALQKV